MLLLKARGAFWSGQRVSLPVGLKERRPRRIIPISMSSNPLSPTVLAYAVPPSPKIVVSRFDPLKFVAQTQRALSLQRQAYLRQLALERPGPAAICLNQY